MRKGHRREARSILAIGADRDSSETHVMNVMAVIVANALRSELHRDPYGVDRARADLDRIYAWLDGELAGRDWACGADFTLAECAAAPSPFYADWAHPIADNYATLKAYRARLLARPSIARCIEEARPYSSYFPLGARTGIKREIRVHTVARNRLRLDRIGLSVARSPPNDGFQLEQPIAPRTLNCVNWGG